MTLEDLIMELQTAVTDLRSSHADLQARFERTFRKGKVTDVDATNHLYRQEVGMDDDGNPVKSPWLPYSQIAGALKVHSPPSVGEQYMAIAPNGDPSQALGFPHGWSDANPSPSKDPAADVSVRGNVMKTVKDGLHLLAVGTTTTNMTAAALKSVSDLVSHGVTGGLASVVMDASGMVHQAENKIAHVAKKVLFNC